MCVRISGRSRGDNEAVREVEVEAIWLLFMLLLRKCEWEWVEEWRRSGGVEEEWRRMRSELGGCR